MSLTQSLGGWLTVRALRHPDLIRAGLTVARELGPIVRLGNGVLLTRRDDILDVLERDEDFHTELQMGAKMLWGAFVLGQDASPAYLQERRVMVEALMARHEDILASVRETSDGLLSGHRGGALDLARDFVARVPLRIEQRVFGVPMQHARTRVGGYRRERGEMAVEFWLRTLGSVIAQGAPAPFGMQARGERCGRELRAFVDRTLAEQRQAAMEGPAGTVLAHLVRHLPDEDAQGRCLAGLMVVNYGIIVRALCLSIDRLLDVDGAMARLNELARAGDRVGLQAMWSEALRFDPAIPVVSRYAARDTVIARGTGREVHLRAGATVVAPLSAAMMDPASTDQPGKFALDRPPHVYQHFGAGIHACLGRFIAEPELTELYLQLFSRLRLARLKGARGRVRFDDLGPAVRHFHVEATPL